MAERARRKHSIGSAASSSALLESVALITSAVPDTRDSGTAVCVHNDGNDSYLLTCDHVLRQLDYGKTDQYLVNGYPAFQYSSGGDRGVDLAILRVPQFRIPACKIRTELNVTAKSTVTGFGYHHLTNGQYASQMLKGTVDEILVLRAHLKREVVTSFRVKSEQPNMFMPGHSGSPLCDPDGLVNGIVAFASNDGRTAYAVSSAAVRNFFPELPLTNGNGGGARGPRDASLGMPPPPPLPEVTVENDLQKNRFGGRSEDDVARLWVRFRGESGSSYFVFDIIVSPSKKNVVLPGPARFFLHDTFPRSLIEIRKPDNTGSLVLSGVKSYGMFTIGCQVFAGDNQWHQLELDLAAVTKDFPVGEIFRSR